MKFKFFVQSTTLLFSLLSVSSCSVREAQTGTNQPNTSKQSNIVDQSKTAERTKTIEQSRSTNQTGRVADTTTGASPSSTKTNVEQAVKGSTNSKTISDLSKKLRTSKLDKLAESSIICSVNGVPITVGDYRHQFRTEQQQMQASLTMDPGMTNKLMQMAQARGLKLSLEDQNHLVDSANKMQTGGKKGFNRMLAENHLTKGQFQIRS